MLIVAYFFQGFLISLLKCEDLKADQLIKTHI